MACGILRGWREFLRHEQIFFVNILILLLLQEDKEIGLITLHWTKVFIE